MKLLATRQLLLRTSWMLAFLCASSLVLHSSVEAQTSLPAATSSATAPRKLALLVGISKYKRGRGANQDWWDLHCESDVRNLKYVLINRFGFAESDITVLTDAKATRQGIIDAFHQLIDQAKPGDVVLFHFSGHGQQVPDSTPTNLLKMQPSLVPFDYVSQRATDGAKSNLTAQQLLNLVDQLEANMQGPNDQMQGNITVFLDSCFAGSTSMAGNGLPTRGRGWNEKIDGARPIFTPTTPITIPIGDGFLGTDKAPSIMLLSATANGHMAGEAPDEKGHPTGAFTYYLTRALQQATPQTTYRSFFEKVSVGVEDAMTSQIPQMAGAADKPLLGGAALPLQPYVMVQKVENNRITLPIGFLQGATAGSRYALFRTGSNELKEKDFLAQAELTSIDETNAQAELLPEYVGKVSPNDLQGARAAETVHNYGENNLKVFIQGSGAWVKAIQAAQAKQDINVMTTKGVTVSNCDVVIRPVGRKLAVFRGGSTEPLALINNDAGAVSKVRDALVGEWRWRYLTRLESTVTSSAGSPLQIDMQLNRIDAPRGESDQGRLRFHYGDKYVLKLRNLSAVDAYVTVLDLSPDGTINPVLPAPYQASTEFNRVPADGQWHEVDGATWAASAPPGREMWKAIATGEPADFRSFLLQKTSNPQGELLYPRLVSIGQRGAPPNPLEKILLTSQTGIRRRGFATAPPSYWATAQISFEVSP